MNTAGSSQSQVLKGHTQQIQNQGQIQNQSWREHGTGSNQEIQKTQRTQLLEKYKKKNERNSTRDTEGENVKKTRTISYMQTKYRTRKINKADTNKAKKTE